jgi:lactoylglutathione lyase
LKQGEDASVSDIEFRFRHTMMPVASIDRSAEFYTGLLGMQVVRLRREPDRGGRNIAYIGYGDEGTHPVLELIEGTCNHEETWSGHIAIAVSDLPTLVEKLKAADVKFAKPMTKPETGTNTYLAIIVDPDGNQIELNQRKGGIYS